MAITYHKNNGNENSLAKVAPIENTKDNVNLNDTPHQETSEAIAQEFRAWRQQLQDIITHMRQASDLDMVLKVTVAKVREKISCDRALIYQFNSADSGTVLAESRNLGWTPALGEIIPSIMFGLHTNYDYVEPISIDDVNQIQLTPYQKQLLDKFQIKDSLSLPIILAGKVWGLLAINSCAGARQWQEVEITLLSQVTTELTHRLQTFEFHRELQLHTQSKQSLGKVIDKILRTSNIDKIFQTTTQEVRQLFKCDRVGLYRFNPDWGGEFVAESVGNGWVKLVGPGLKTTWEDSYLQDTQGGRYRHQENFIVNDIYKTNHSPCHLEILEQFEVKAYIIVPVFTGEKLWGLLAAYQNSGSREWQSWEVDFLTQIGLQFGVAIAHAEYLEQMRMQSEQLIQIAEKEKAFTKIVNRIHQAQDVDSIFRATTQEVRQSLKCDRVVVYQFTPDWGGVFVAESVGQGWTKLASPDLKTVLNDTYLQDTKGGKYVRGENCVVNDIYTIGLTGCHIDILEAFEAKAYIIVPIFFDDKLWGLLAAYQNSSSREWQSWEVNFLTQIAAQFSLAKSQLDYLEEVRIKTEKLTQIADQEKAFTKIVNRIRQALDLEEIFKISTQEVRQLLKCDRVAIFRFNPNWGGVFVAESVGHNWVKLVGPNLQTAWEDTYIQETQGGRYAKGESYVVNDVYQAGHAACHLEILEQFEVRGYIIVPIFFGEQLWGLLAAYQNSGPRDWEESQVALLARIGDQLGLALQQTEYLQKLQTQSTQLAEAAARDKAAKELLQQRSIQLLMAVRPALNGDLTVRAPITEDELGTIADAYNNTLQALRQIVLQVQTSAGKVAQTSSTSNTSLAGLNNLAQQQSDEINLALGEIQQMLNATQAVVASAELVQVAVKQANQTVESGDAAMNQTVQAIQAIRETVAQTSKKIKRLGESSQKISKVVNLISNFATQTNVLALNAAIEATRAGEYGKGFAVVADEVRSLSRQSAAATIEIEKLVQEIQEETGEVAVAMEAGIQQVVEGTNFVSQTRQNLNAIVSATAEISQLIHQITDATQKQMGQSVSVTNSMKDVAEIANKTFGESQEIAAVFQDLSNMAQDLLTTASKFKVS
ncbi:GAF domain-containing protein [Nostoc sp. UHCC 0870]|uniref:GAF domain-containing protein n=1 Tax=Nostoc sp. UHCC 0870 TaxID=2914041 RepID=UPI001EDEF279|nr:GAF domain-containing protein [Nostoc sp. UHCC 0870]UKO99824.1 GAF domain-containing protein [Nostoc sp. UHCC 0870]